MFDMGCGQGYLIDAIPSIDQYVGIDNHTLSLEQAKTRYPHFSFYQTNLHIEPLLAPLFEERLNLILLLVIAEHTTSFNLVLQHLKRFLTKNGKVIITTATYL